MDSTNLVDITALQQALVPRDRPMLLNHWATWCEGCVVELPLLVGLHERWGDRVDSRYAIRRAVAP